VKAREIDPGNPVVLFNLASARERIGEMDEAAVLLTQSLRHSPAWEDAARRLSTLLGRFKVETAAEFDPHGLLAAFAFKHIDHQTIAAAALDHLKAATSLGQAVEQAGWAKRMKRRARFCFVAPTRCLPSRSCLQRSATARIAIPGLKRC
jgi:LmbE family N-acetylglucosaminyl deacetylase